MRREINSSGMICLTLMMLLVAVSARGAERTSGRLLWRIGTPDGSDREFALAPDAYGKFQRDGFFVAGASEARQSWPYVQPGPADRWAGGRAHTNFVLFGLKEAPRTGRGVLSLDLLDTQNKVPPKLRIQINDFTIEKQLPAGRAGMAILKGQASKGLSQHLEVEFPASALKEGDNRVEITTLTGSWMVYDAVRMEAPAGVQTAPTALTTIDAIRAPQALVRRGSGVMQPVTVTVGHYGPPAEATVRVGDQATTHAALAIGENTIAVPLTPVERATTVTVAVEVSGKPLATRQIGLRPVRHWTIYILPHSHVDIGFTNVQTEIEKKQIGNIDRAIELARATAGNPEGERFKWNVEVLWAVESYLKQGPEQRRKFVEAVKAGWIGLDALYCNILTGLCRPEELARLVQFAKTLERECGVKIDSAMISDVPGLTWGITSVLSHAGVRYISDGVNFVDRIGGARVMWQDKPMWWVSPSGREKVLFWTPFSGYSGGRRMKPHMETGLLDRLGELEASGYPYDLFQLRWCIGDNGVPDEALVGIVQKWNAEHAWPRLALATTSQMFHELEKRWGDKLPTWRGDFTPYWEDGAGSSARETAINRATAERLSQAEALCAMVAPGKYPAGDFWQAWRNVLLYSEHTWGANVSVRQPDSEMTKAQWAIKQTFALDGEKESRKLLETALGARGTESGAAIDVFNTSSWPRTDLVTVPKELSQGRDLVSLEDGATGPWILHSQRLAGGELAFVAKVQPFAAERYRLSAGDARRVDIKSPGDAASASGLELSNGLITVKVDPQTGTIAELHARGIEGNLVDAKAETRMNEYFYLIGGDLKDMQRAGAPKIRIGERGPLVASLIIESEAPGCNKLTRELRLVAGIDTLFITNTVDKKAVREKEGVHFGFGFNVPGGQARVETPYAVVRPDADQIPAACKNWFTVQRWVDVSNQDYGVTWATVDAPLVELGGITANLPDHQPDPEIWRKHVGPAGTLYSWVMNNHWHTNYRAEQDGPTVFRYAIRPHAGGFAPDEAARFGVQCSQPLIAAAAAGAPATAPHLKVEPAGVVVSALKPSNDGKALIVRLYGASGRDERARVTFADPQPKRVTLSDLDEHAGAAAQGTVDVPAWDFVTLRAELP